MHRVTTPISGYGAVTHVPSNSADRHLCTDPFGEGMSRLLLMLVGVVVLLIMQRSAPSQYRMAV
jgi:hypothetical protein